MVEIIFLHLPKTGGSSILKHLIHNYGETNVRHFERDECIELAKESKRISDVLLPEVKVIHGHFLFEEINDIYERDKPKLITFMRSPVNRVVSNFNWFKHRLAQNESSPDRHRINEPLEKYIKDPNTQNKMTRFLNGSSVKDFYFIGFLESFDSDLITLGKALNWKELPIYHEKNIKPNEGELSNSLLKKIKKLNAKDVLLYEDAKKHVARK